MLPSRTNFGSQSGLVGVSRGTIIDNPTQCESRVLKDEFGTPTFLNYQLLARLIVEVVLQAREIPELKAELTL